MSRINIPSKVIPGFKMLSELDDNKINQLVSILKEVKIGIKFDRLEEELHVLFKPSEAKHLIYTIISFSNLFENEVDFNQLASDLSTSYYELEESIEKSESRLESNLKKIFIESQNLFITIKARNLAMENENTLTSVKVISDIRPVFNFDLVEKNRSAVILHKMQFSFKKSTSIKEIEITMDTDDLNLINKSIERAIKKSEILRQDYKSNFNFIN